MVAIKTSKWELAIKYEDYIKNSSNLLRPMQGHSLTSALFILDPAGEIYLELHVLYLL